jgi:hypothetical protein
MKAKISSKIEDIMRNINLAGFAAAVFIPPLVPVASGIAKGIMQAHGTTIDSHLVDSTLTYAPTTLTTVWGGYWGYVGRKIVNSDGTLNKVGTFDDHQKVKSSVYVKATLKGSCYGAIFGVTAQLLGYGIGYGIGKIA